MPFSSYENGSRKLENGFDLTHLVCRYLPSFGRKTSSGSLKLQLSCTTNGKLAEMMCAVGLSNREQKFVMIILAAILCMGNICFGEDPGGSLPFRGQTEQYLHSVSVRSTTLLLVLYFFAVNNVSSNNSFPLMIPSLIFFPRIC